MPKTNGLDLNLDEVVECRPLRLAERESQVLAEQRKSAPREH